MNVQRYRLILSRRREERELRVRLRRVLASGLVPVLDDPIELPAELIDVSTGRLADRRRRARRP